MDVVEVFCGKEFVLGYLYVVLFRVRSKEWMCRIGFDRRKLILFFKEVLYFFENI